MDRRGGYGLQGAVNPKASSVAATTARFPWRRSIKRIPWRQRASNGVGGGRWWVAGVPRRGGHGVAIALTKA